jgi:septin family protein
LILDPARLEANVVESRKMQAKDPSARGAGGLDENLDLNVLRELQGKTTVIPVISKADTITAAHMRHLKKMVWGTIKRAKLDPLEALHLSDSDDEDDDRLDERDEDAYVHSDAEDKADGSDAGSDASAQSSASQTPPTSPPSARKTHNRKPSAMSASFQNEDMESPYLPFSIISPDPYEPEVVGRKFPWGFADPYNADHCDFVKLQESVFNEWRSELREASRERWYEGWRTNRLQRSPATRRIVTADGPTKHRFAPPSTNGRATSAGGHDYRQERSAAF